MNKLQMKLELAKKAITLIVDDFDSGYKNRYKNAFMKYVG